MPPPAIQYHDRRSHRRLCHPLASSTFQASALTAPVEASAGSLNITISGVDTSSMATPSPTPPLKLCPFFSSEVIDADADRDSTYISKTSSSHAKLQTPGEVMTSLSSWFASKTYPPQGVECAISFTDAAYRAPAPWSSGRFYTSMCTRLSNESFKFLAKQEMTRRCQTTAAPRAQHKFNSKLAVLL
ncbi:hypothetical protein CPC08DRAFT_713195 [Agrocybe pediades]|nr:hypothetical protein CPC08DRAFT_713195 [Agrocybe pediades]